MNVEEPTTVAVIEDDQTIREFLLNNLELDGYRAVGADSVAEGLRVMEHRYPDLALIDIGLPDGRGLDLLERIRQSDGIVTRIDPDLPVVIVSGFDGELDRLRGFDRGCDDYVIKPFSYPELRARIVSVLRRRNTHRTRGKCRIGSIEIDPASREVTVCGSSIGLSQKEFALLMTLASEPTRVFRKSELLRNIWGFRSLGATRTLDSHACRLRRKLKEASKGDRFVVNVWGVGYRLVDGVVDRDETEGSD